ncbi:hypothetical protein N779_22730 [Vibrio coralliilyticus OCN008]|nr:hypothetical protein N779_22730 [Vibrio coralliilyticus OCN008]
MNSLLEELIKQGYKTKSEANRISIRLSWTTMPVLITRNIQSNTYELKLQYWRYIIVVVAFSFNALIGIHQDNSVSYIGWGALSLLYLASGFLVHHKTKELRSYVGSLNRTHHT